MSFEILSEASLGLYSRCSHVPPPEGYDFSIRYEPGNQTSARFLPMRCYFEVISHWPSYYKLMRRYFSDHDACLDHFKLLISDPDGHYNDYIRGPTSAQLEQVDDYEYAGTYRSQSAKISNNASRIIDVMGVFIHPKSCFVFPDLDFTATPGLGLITYNSAGIRYPANLRVSATSMQSKVGFIVGGASVIVRYRYQPLDSSSSRPLKLMGSSVNAMRGMGGVNDDFAGLEQWLNHHLWITDGYFGVGNANVGGVSEWYDFTKVHNAWSEVYADTDYVPITNGDPDSVNPDGTVNNSVSDDGFISDEDINNDDDYFVDLTDDDAVSNIDDFNASTVDNVDGVSKPSKYKRILISGGLILSGVFVTKTVIHKLNED